LGGNYSAANDINDDGWAVGDAADANGEHRAFRVAPEPDRSLVDLGTLGGPGSIASSISSLGVIVGFAGVAGSGDVHAFMIDAPPALAMLDLGTLGGDNSYAYGINSKGQIVGASQTSAGVLHAFIWDPESRVMIDLNELLPRAATGWELQFATEIEDNGAIVGSAAHDGAAVAYLLIPVDER
jgi:probable HAF family extracellular repeat protein